MSGSDQFHIPGVPGKLTLQTRMAYSSVIRSFPLIWRGQGTVLLSPANVEFQTKVPCKLVTVSEGQ